MVFYNLDWVSVSVVVVVVVEEGLGKLVRGGEVASNGRAGSSSSSSSSNDFAG